MNRDLRRTVFAILGAVLLVVALAVAGRQLEEHQKTWDVATIDNPKSAGLKHVYEALKEAGVPVRILRQPLKHLNKTDGLLVLATASRQPVSKADAEALRTWIENGGTLLYLARLGIGGSPLDVEVREALGLQVVDAPELSFRWRVLLDASAPLYIPHPLKKGITSLSFDKSGSFRLKGDERYIPLAGEEKDIRGWLGRMGKGTVVALDTGYPVSNGSILKADNLQFLVNLISLAGADRPVVFAEYYHHTDYARTMVGLLTSEGLLVPLIQFGLALLLLLAAVMPRFGDPVPLYRSVVHSAPDYIAAFADITLSRRNGDYRSLIRGSIAAFQYRAGKRLGFPPMETEAFLERIGRLRVMQPRQEAIDSLKEACRSTGPGDPEELLRVSRLCHRLNRQLFHTPENRR